MGFLADLGIAPGSTSADDVEKSMASGGLPPEGIHHAVLKWAEAPNSKINGHKLIFKIIAGPGEGAEVEDVVWRPKGEDAKKDKKILDRAQLFGKRLGLLKADANGKLVEVEGKHGFGDCLGAACFLELKHEDDDWTTPDGRKKSIKKARVTFGGMIDPTDKRVANVPKGDPAKYRLAGAGGGAASAQRSNLDNL